MSPPTAVFTMPPGKGAAMRAPSQPTAGAQFKVIMLRDSAIGQSSAELKHCGHGNLVDNGVRAPSLSGAFTICNVVHAAQVK